MLARACSLVAKVSPLISSFLNEASFPSILQARCLARLAWSTRPARQVGRGLSPTVVLDLECPQPAESPDFRGVGPRDPPAILTSQLPRV
jgi:hypothetical protein